MPQQATFFASAPNDRSRPKLALPCLLRRGYAFCVDDCVPDRWFGIWPMPPDPLHERNHRIRNQHQEKPRAEFRDRHRRPARALVRISPGPRESACVFSEPDERRDEAKPQKQRHRAVALPDAVINPGASEQDRRDAEQRDASIRNIMMREEVHVDGNGEQPNRP